MHQYSILKQNCLKNINDKQDIPEGSKHFSFLGKFYNVHNKLHYNQNLKINIYIFLELINKE